MPTLDCHSPGNGPLQCIRDEDFERISLEQRELRTLHERFQQRVIEETVGIFAAISRLETKVDRLVDGVAIGNVRPVQHSMRDWDPDEPTGVHEPGEWADRARRETERSAVLAAQVAALEARWTERERFSERVRSDGLAAQKHQIQRWQIVAGVLIAIMSSVGALLVQWILGG